MSADPALQSEARKLEVFTTIGLWLVILSIAGRFILYPIFHALPDSAFNTPEFDTTANDLIITLPAVILAGGLNAARKLFGRIRKGEMFTDAVGRGVREIGQSLLGAAVAMAVVVPWLQAWVDGKYGFGGIKLDTLIWTLGVVGFAMMMVGRLLKQAGALKDELEQFV